MFFDAFLQVNSRPKTLNFLSDQKFKMRDCRLSDDYTSLIFKYCDEHPDLTIKQLEKLVKRTKPRVKFNKKKQIAGRQTNKSNIKNQTDEKNQMIKSFKI